MRIYGAISVILLGAMFGTCDRYLSARDLLRGPAFAKEAAAIQAQAARFQAKRPVPCKTPLQLGTPTVADHSAPAVRGAAQYHAPSRSGSPPSRIVT